MPNQYLPGVITIPSSLLITAATQAYPMVITTAIGAEEDSANTYIVGMCVRLFIPRAYGMWQANGRTATILVISGDDFYLDVDSTYFDAFSVPGGSVEKPASLSPNGSRNLQYSNLTNQVPFQSLNNIGN